MYSAKNSLKVWTSLASGPSQIAALADLPVGEIGFFDATGAAIATTGTGTFCFKRRDGKLLRSKEVTFAAAWKNSIVAYAAPVLEKVKIVPVAANSTLYQVRIEMQIPGMGGSYIKHGQYKSDATAIIAEIVDGLVTSLTNAFAREPQSYFTFSNVGNELVIETKHLTYVRGKKSSRPAWFKASLTFPETQAVLATLVTNRSDGHGHGPYVAEKEFFSQGDSDAMRFQGWPNSFDDAALHASVSGKYDVLPLTIDEEVKTNNASVYAPQQYLIAFNTIGAGVVPVITKADDSDNVVEGTCNPDDVIAVYLDGVLLGTDTTTPAGTFSVAGAVVAGNVATAIATPVNGTPSVASAPFVAVA